MNVRMSKWYPPALSSPWLGYARVSVTRINCMASKSYRGIHTSKTQEKWAPIKGLGRDSVVSTTNPTRMFLPLSLRLLHSLLPICILLWCSDFLPSPVAVFFCFFFYFCFCFFFLFFYFFYFFASVSAFSFSSSSSSFCSSCFSSFSFSFMSHIQGVWGFRPSK